MAGTKEGAPGQNKRLVVRATTNPVRVNKVNTEGDERPKGITTERRRLLGNSRPYKKKGIKEGTRKADSGQGEREKQREGKRSQLLSLGYP